MEETLANVDRLIRAGDLASARLELLKINSKKVQKPYLAKLANLYRRTGQTELAINSLRKTIRPSGKKVSSASAEDKVEYAMALIKLGTINEGIRLLESVDGTDTPNKHLYLSFAHITRWDYNKAATQLETYISHLKVDEYSRLTAKVNLLSCYIFLEKFEEGMSLVLELLEKTDKPEFSRLNRNILYLESQIFLAQGQYSQSRKILSRIISKTASISSNDQLLAQKSNLVLELHEKGSSKEVLASFEKLKLSATELGNFEAIRDIDYHVALYTKDFTLLHYVYFGTPQSSYKNKIKVNYKNLYKEELIIPKNFEYLPNPNSQENLVQMGHLSMFDGTHSFSDLRINPDSLIHKLLGLLVKDFYRPLGVFQIHDELFNEHYFNLVSSPKRVTQITYRLNQWFLEAGVPLIAESKKEIYTLRSLSPIAVVVSTQKSIPLHLQLFQKELHKAFGNNWFASSEASRELAIAQRTATRNLNEGLGAGLLEKSGLGPKTRFKIKDH